MTERICCSQKAKKKGLTQGKHVMVSHYKSGEMYLCIIYIYITQALAPFRVNVRVS
jgi:hypothetical protein